MSVRNEALAAAHASRGRPGCVRCLRRARCSLRTRAVLGKRLERLPRMEGGARGGWESFSAMVGDPDAVVGRLLA